MTLNIFIAVFISHNFEKGKRVKEVSKDLYKVLAEAGADSGKAQLSAEIKLMLVELRRDTTFLKLAILIIISLKALGYFAI